MKTLEEIFFIISYNFKEVSNLKSVPLLFIKKNLDKYTFEMALLLNIYKKIYQ